MQIELAKHAGHCFGVKAAIKIAFETAREARLPVFTFGPIIHNPQVVTELEKAGVKAVNDLSQIPEGVIIIRSHGVSPEVIRAAEARGLTVVDATCPFVKRAQNLAQELIREGYSLVLLGDAAHPEVEGILGTVNRQAVVVSNAQEAAALPAQPRYGLIAQTTQSLENLQRVASTLLTLTRELKILNTICNATTDLQIETRSLAGRVQLMLVVGGRASANTAQLRVICERAGVATRQIETAEEIDRAWLAGVQCVGVTAGTSTPDWVIEKIVEKLEHLGTMAASA